MFRLFDNLVDPYAKYEETDAPPTGDMVVLARLCSTIKGRFFSDGCFVSCCGHHCSLAVRAPCRLVHILTQGTSEQVWVQSGKELILVVFFLLTLRPVMQAVHVLLLSQTIMPNFATLVRWRAHRQVLRQSVGWFEDDFAGRIANRIMQILPAADEVVFSGV